MNRPNLRTLFSACDVNKSGLIEYEDFTVVCRELNVADDEIKSLFSKFDADEEGCIDFNTFSSQFQDVSETLDFTSFGGSVQAQASPLDEFQSMADGAGAAGLLSERLQQQLACLYQALHSSSERQLLQQFEGDFIQAFVRENMDHRLESQRLERRLKRMEEMNSSQLAELDDDMQQKLAQVEERVREEEHRRMKDVTAALQRRHENELADLRASVDRLLKHQEESEHNILREDAEKLRNRIRELTQDNEHLRGSLLKAQTNISILQVEMDELKNMYADQKVQHERERDDLTGMVMEYQSYSSHVDLLQEMNQKLYDSNDGLRSALTKDAMSPKRKLSPMMPKDEHPARRMKPRLQSTLNHSSSVQDDSAVGKMEYSNVASWADKYLDSGVVMETADSRASNYDSDDSMASVETVHRSYSYVPSEIEISDVKSEATLSAVPSWASSVRKPLSAFPTKETEADVVETDGSALMYRLVLAGNTGAGKSSFLLRLSTNDFRTDMQTTLGIDFQMKKMQVDGEMTNLQIWDTAGQERFRSIARSYFRKANGVLLLYDVTSESSFLSVREWVDQIQDAAGEKIPMCLIGNKVDLRPEQPQGGCVSTKDGERLAKTYNALFCETSAKEGTNVVETVLHLARAVKKNVILRQRSESQVKLSQTKPKKTPGICCGGGH